MTGKFHLAVLVSIIGLATAGCHQGSADSPPQPLNIKTAEVDDVRLRAAEADSANWLTYGRTYSEQRFSPLTQIDTRNVKDLRLAWWYEMKVNRGVEATPLVADGVMYVTSAWSMVYALDARTGKELWFFDP